MFDALLSLTDADLRTLAMGLRDQRIAPPFNVLAVGRCIGASSSEVVAQKLNEFNERGNSPGQIAVILDALAAGRSNRFSPIDSVELVWTAPQAAGADRRENRTQPRPKRSSAASG